MALLHRASVAAEVAWTVRGDAPSTDATLLIRRAGAHPPRRTGSTRPSTGERQRAAIAAVLAGARGSRSLTSRPVAWTTRPETHSAVRSLACRAAGGSIVIATHDKNLVAALADRTIAVGAGSARELAPVAVA